jgi:hypothetical protein
MSPAALGARIAFLREQEAETGRGPLPVTARVGVRFDGAPASGFALSGSPDAMLADLDAYRDLGVEELAFAFGETDAERARNAIERFDRDVLSALR